MFEENALVGSQVCYDGQRWYEYVFTMLTITGTRCGEQGGQHTAHSAGLNPGVGQ